MISIITPEEVFSRISDSIDKSIEICNIVELRKVRSSNPFNFASSSPEV